jgi:trehalose synthase
MNRVLEDYEEIVGDRVIADIYDKARPLSGKHIVQINSTYQGGGVAEMLSSLIPLMNYVGIQTGWRILHGNPDFFGITKKFHNALHGEEINLTPMKKRIYLETNENFSVFTHMNHDCVIVHDPQPLPLINFYQKKQPWIWRCHVDLSNPDKEVWNYLKKFLMRYDMVIVSHEKYLRNDLLVEQRVSQPAIDPLSSKNMELSQQVIQKYLKKFGIPTDKPLITQISRFDKWKNPEKVIAIYREVKKSHDCRLVLCGSMASDDPEATDIFTRVKESVANLTPQKDVILVTSENNILVNAIQRASSVIIQRSSKEGFGMTVTEALWKEKPVVASNVGGIPLQIRDGESGYLVDPEDTRGFVMRVKELLDHPDLAQKMGGEGKETVRENFLITRLLKDHILFTKEVIDMYNSKCGI